MVDGINIDKLFTKAQTAPTTAPVTTGSDASLAAISTTMKNISSKNIAHSAHRRPLTTTICQRIFVRDLILRTIQSRLLPSNI